MTATTTVPVDVGPLVLGGNTFGWTSDERESFAVLDAFIGHGGRFVDTADAYSAWVPGHRGGESERVIGQWLQRHPARREQLTIATKVSRHPEFPGLSRANVIAAADASLHRLGVDSIDIYYPHYDDVSLPIEEIVEVFRDLQLAGKIRGIGLSNFTAERAEAWMVAATAAGYPLPAFLQPHYNLVFRHEYESGLAAVADRHGLTVLPYFALASGLLSGKYRTAEDIAASARARFTSRYATAEAFEVVAAVIDIAADHAASPATVALAWLRTRPRIAAPLASARSIEQLPDLLAALELRPDERERLDTLSAQIPE